MFFKSPCRHNRKSAQLLFNVFFSQLRRLWIAWRMWSSLSFRFHYNRFWCFLKTFSIFFRCFLLLFCFLLFNPFFNNNLTRQLLLSPSHRSSINLDTFRSISTRVWVDIVCFHVITIDETALCWMSIFISIGMEGRLSKVCRDCWVRKQSSFHL